MDRLLWSYVVIVNLIRVLKYLNLIDYNPDKTFKTLNLMCETLDLTWKRFNVMIWGDSLCARIASPQEFASGSICISKYVNAQL